MRDLGLMGESAFSLWCNSVGLVANGSKIDKTGWDFFVEFPISHVKDLPVDMLPAPLECKVQVKATDQKNRQTQITVSNLHRLVKAPVPTFICFIEFDGKNEAQAAYLVHIDQKIIEQTLKRMRELEVKGQARELNKRKITIKYSNKEKLKNPNGESLKESIEQCVPHGAEVYIENKNNLLKTLGFETGSGQFNVELSGKDPISDMVDLTLGLRKEINIDKFVGRHERFGILSPTPFVEAEKGILAILDVKPFSKAVLTFKEYKFSPGISFSTDFYSSQLYNVVPDKYLKFRVKGKFFEMVFEPINNKAHYTFHLDPVDGSSLKELRDMLKVLTLFQKSPNTLELEIKPDGLPPLCAKIGTDEKLEDWSNLYNVAEMAVSICNELKIPSDAVIVNTASLVKHALSIGNFLKILNGTPSTAKVEFTIEGEDLNTDKKTSCIFFCQTHIGDHAVGCHLGMIGTLELLGEKSYRLNIEEYILGHHFVSKQDNDFSQEILDNEFKSFSENVETKGLVAIRMFS